MMTMIFRRLAAALGLLTCLAWAGGWHLRPNRSFLLPAGQAQVDRGGLPVMSGPAHYEAVSREIAMMGRRRGAVRRQHHGRHPRRRAGKEATSPGPSGKHARPARQGGPIGFSPGGGIVFAYGTHWADQVNGVVVWYLATKFVDDPHRFVDARAEGSGEG